MTERWGKQITPATTGASRSRAKNLQRCFKKHEGQVFYHGEESHEERSREDALEIRGYRREREGCTGKDGRLRTDRLSDLVHSVFCIDY